MKVSISNTFKIVVLGSSGVGKSAIVRRLIENTFTPEGQPTVGVEFKPYIVPVNDQPVKLQIWDTAGQERFKSVSRAYFRNAVGAVLVYDVTVESSFDALDDWLNDLQQLCNPNASILLVGNKTDLDVDRKVGIEQARDFAEKHRLEYLETSALSGANVTEAFTRLAFAVAKKVQSKQIEGGPGKAPTVKVDPVAAEPARSECC
jgi:small GTP-binding protein